MTKRGPANPEKSFGISVGGMLVLIAGYLWWTDRLLPAQITGAIGAVLVTFGLLAPRLLKWPSAIWWRFALILGYINARVILTLIFALILTPISLLWRILGRDPLARSRQSWPGWTPHPARYKSRAHYERMY